MSTISVTNINDGDAVTAASVNNQINTIVNDYNGNITDANVATGAAIGAQKLAGGVSGMFGAWQSWAPTYFNITVGNGTVVAKYIQIGKTVSFRYKLSFGSTSGISTAPTISLPVTAHSEVNGTGIGSILITNHADTSYRVPGVIFLASTTTVNPYGFNVNAAAVPITATVPQTWGTADVLEMYGTYEAA